MTTYNARNERIKREYFRILKEADQLSDSTIQGVRMALVRYEEFTGYSDFSSFNDEQAIAFKKHFASKRSNSTGKEMSRATVFSTVQALQAFFRWLSREPGYKSKIRQSDIRYLNLSRKDVAIATAARTKRIPTLEQIKAVIAMAPAETEVQRRDRALLAFAILTGIRDSALASLKLRHIDNHQRLVHQDPAQVETKFSKRIETYFFPIDDDLETIALEWVSFLREKKLYGNDDPLFPRTKVTATRGLRFVADGLEPLHWSSAGQIREIFKVAFERAGIPYFNPHSFRDTLTILGEQMCQTPEQFKAWSQNLGHESPLTTFTSYGKVSLHRQGELIRSAAVKEGDDSKIDRLMDMVKKLQNGQGTAA